VVGEGSVEGLVTETLTLERCPPEYDKSQVWPAHVEMADGLPLDQVTVIDLPLGSVTWVSCSEALNV
jgi:hypothetical protein